MMKCKKLISALCATAMLFSLASFANAAEVDDPVSEFAGQTIVCQVFDEVDGEVTSRLIKVSIPEGTTLSEEAALLVAAAYGPKARSARGNVDIISTEDDITITSNSTYVGGGVAKQTYARIHAGFHITKMSGNTNQTISVHCRNNTSGDQSAWKKLDVYNVAQTVIFTTSDVEILKGNNFTVNARTNFDTAECSSCIIQGSTF